MPELTNDQSRVLQTLYEWQYIPMPVGRRLPTKVPDYLVSAVLADWEWDRLAACLDELVADELAKTDDEPPFGGRWVLADGREILAQVWDLRVPGETMSVKDKLRVLYGDMGDQAAGFIVKIREPGGDLRTHIEYRGLTNHIPDNMYSLTREGIEVARQIMGLIPAPGVGSADTAAETPTETTTPVCSHSPDFISVEWFGTRYTFAKGFQASVVKALWEAWKSGNHGLTVETLADRVGSDSSHFRLAKVFRQKRKEGGGYDAHPAWTTMIQEASKGCYWLVKPESSE